MTYLDKLKGYRTYIAAAATAAVVFLKGAGVITPAQFEVVGSVGALLVAAFIRANQPEKPAAETPAA